MSPEEQLRDDVEDLLRRVLTIPLLKGLLKKSVDYITGSIVDMSKNYVELKLEEYKSKQLDREPP